jgi:hypothetical protein
VERSGSHETPKSVFGLRIHGVDGGGLLPPAHDNGWPDVTIEHSLGPSAPSGEWRLGFGGRRACLPLPGGLLRLERERARMTVRSETPLPEDQLVHPWLTSGAAMFARWHGREALHGGAVVIGGEAWAVLATKTGGKSTLLAWLASRGHGIVSDDLLVIEGLRVFAGPRCLDLRPDMAEALSGDGLRPAREASRRRVVLEPVPDVLTLGGIVHLAWGDGVAAARVPVAERIARLRMQNAFGAAPAGERALLELAALPTVELRRPRVIDSLEAGADALLEAAHAAPRLRSS